MNRRLPPVIAGTLLSALLLTQPIEAAQPPPINVSQLMPALMVKVKRLTGVGPDANRHELMSVPEGVVAPIDDFSILAPRLTVAGSSTPTAYHALQAELAPGVFVHDETGKVVCLANPASVPAIIPLVGAVLSLNGEVKALGVKPEVHRPDVRAPDLGVHRDHDD